MRKRLPSGFVRRAAAAGCALLADAALVFLLKMPTGLGFVPALLAVALYALFRYAFRPGCGRACRRAALICAALYTVFHIAGDYRTLVGGTLSANLALLPVWLGLYALYVGVTALFMRAAFRFTSLRAKGPAATPRARRAARLLPFAVILLCWSVYLLALFPGNVVPDSLEQLREARGEAPYNQLYSAAHTFLIGLILNPVLRWTGQNLTLAVGAYCAVQMTLMAAVCGYAVYVLYVCGVRRWIVVAATLFFAVMPYNGFFSVTILKDVPFSASVLLLSAALYRYWYRRRETGTPGLRPYRTELSLAFVSGVLICLLRVNGMAMFAPFCAVALIFGRKTFRAMLPPLFAALALAAAIQYAAYPLLGVQDRDEVERYFVPFQQMARVVVDDQPLTDEELAELNRFMAVDKIKDAYEGTLSDPIKYLVRDTCGNTYLSEHKAELFRLWLTLGRKYPLSYLRAQIDLNSGFYYPRLFYVYTERIAVTYDSLRNYPKLPAQAVSLLKAWGAFFSDNGTWSLPWMIAGPVWVMWFLAVFCAATRRWTPLVLLTPALLLWAILLITTPLSGEFRYLYALFLGLPLYGAAAFAQTPEAQPERGAGVASPTAAG